MDQGRRTPRGGRGERADMNPQWGRSEAAGAWLNPKPAWTIATLAIALTSTVAIAGVRYAVVWTPLPRAYLSAYVRSAVMDALGFTKTGRYRLLQVVDRSGHRLALEEEVQPGASAAGEAAFVLTDAARQMGDRDVIWESGTYPHATLHAFL